MDTKQLNQALFNKMAAEQEAYRSHLLGQTPKEALAHAYEYAMREDILMEMAALELPDDQAKALLASPDTMADVYKTFSKMMDTGHMDMIRECIEEQAKALIQSGVLSQPEADRQEAAYLVDRAFLLHLKETQGGDFEYAVFDRQTKEKRAVGRISVEDVMGGIDPTHGCLAAARDAVIQETGLNGIETAQVGLTSLKTFPQSDIYRRQVWEPETLPKNDIRFINSGYDEQFRIPDGGTIQIEYPDRALSAKCEYIDDYHAYIGTEVYHMCQFAELLERNGGVCRPEPVQEAERTAWKIGWNASLAVECGAGHWDYHLFDDHFNEIKGGELEVVGCSINEVRDMILAENKLGRRSMTPTDYRMLMEKAAARKEVDAAEKQPEKKPSVKEKLTAKPIPGDRPAKPKDRGAR